MASPVRLISDPRSVARDIPGIFDTLLPQLAPGVVAHFNRKAYAITGCKNVSSDLVAASSLQHAMLFEIAMAISQQLLEGCKSIDFDGAVEVAIARQRRYFDARLPEQLTETDKQIATLVAENLVVILDVLRERHPDCSLVSSPHIPGFNWIASGNGDFSLGSRLIEVKCSNKPFSSSDYRQVMMYWLLSYAASVEGRTSEWSDVLLINPRLDKIVELSFSELIRVAGAGSSKVAILERFSSMFASQNTLLLKQDFG